MKDCFEQAIARDPTFALAHAGLADWYAEATIAGLVVGKQAIPVAMQNAHQAVVLDDTLAEAHTALGTIAACDYDWQQAEREFRIALELNPASPHCHNRYAFYLLMPLGRLQEAEAELRRAVELDPLSLWLQSHVCYLLHLKRECQPAIEHSTRLLELSADYAESHCYLGFANLQLGKFDEAVRAMERSHTLTRPATLTMALLGLAYARAGRTVEARKLLGDLISLSRISHVPPVFLGWAYVGLGEMDTAVECFDNALEDRAAAMLFFPVEPFYDPARSHPRYQALLRKMNLAP